MYSRLYFPDEKPCDPRQPCCDLQDALCCQDLRNCFTPDFYASQEERFTQDSGMTVDHESVVLQPTMRIKNNLNIFASIDYCIGRVYFPTLAPLTEPEAQKELWVPLSYCPFSGEKQCDVSPDEIENVLPALETLPPESGYCCTRLQRVVHSSMGDLLSTMIPTNHPKNNGSISEDQYLATAQAGDASAHEHLIKEGDGSFWIVNAVALRSDMPGPGFLDKQMNYCLFCGTHMQAIKQA